MIVNRNLKSLLGANLEQSDILISDQVEESFWGKKILNSIILSGNTICWLMLLYSSLLKTKSLDNAILNLWLAWSGEPLLFIQNIYLLLSRQETWYRIGLLVPRRSLKWHRCWYSLPDSFWCRLIFGCFCLPYFNVLFSNLIEMK